MNARAKEKEMRELQLRLGHWEVWAKSKLTLPANSRRESLRTVCEIHYKGVTVHTGAGPIALSNMIENVKRWSARGYVPDIETAEESKARRERKRKGVIPGQAGFIFKKPIGA